MKKFKMYDPVYKLGTIHLFKRQVVRKMDFDKSITGNRFESFPMVWTTIEVPFFLGMYIGYRFKQNGYTINHQEDGLEWKCTGIVKVALVIKNERTNPIFVPFEDLPTTKPVDKSSKCST